MARLTIFTLYVTSAILVLVEGIGFNADSAWLLPLRVLDTYDIDNVRVFGTAAEFIKWAGGPDMTTVGSTVGIRNEDVPKLAASADELDKWYTEVIDGALKSFRVTHITVGNEMIPGPFAREVLTVIKSLQDKLVKIGKADMVTTSVGSSVLGASYPPSTGEFAANNLNDMKDVLRLLSAYGAPLMINVYPYYAYAADRSHVPLDYALFNATAPVVHDGELAYQNLFDAMVDSFYWAMEKAEYRNVSIVVSETGWPRTGTIPEIAETYNRNLVKRMKSGVGTPKRRNDTFGAFIYAYHDGPHDSLEFSIQTTPTGLFMHFQGI